MTDSAPTDLNNALFELRRIKHENAKLLEKQRLLESELKTVTNTFIFPFLQLSRELRDMVYKNLFESPNPILVQSGLHCCRYSNRQVFATPMLQTSRQIYEEVLPIFYGGNQVFQFCGDEGLSNFRATIGETARGLIRSLDISFNVGPFVGIHAMLRDFTALRTLTLRTLGPDVIDTQDPQCWKRKRGFEDLLRLRGLESVEFGRYSLMSVRMNGTYTCYAVPHPKTPAPAPRAHSDEEAGSDEEDDDDLDDYDASAYFDEDFPNEEDWLTADSEAGKKFREKLTRPRTT